MNPRRTWAVARKEFIHVMRDPRSLSLGIAMPVFMLLMFGYALTLDVDRVPLLIWDRSQTPMSRDFLSQFTGSRYFSLFGYANSYREIEEAIDSRKALFGMVVPTDFAGELSSGRTVSVQLIADGSDSNTATIALGYANAVSATFNRRVMMAQVERAGIPVPRMPLDLRARVWFNADLQSRNYIIPGLIAIIMSVIGAMLTSLTVAREWERGTMEQLISTPVRVPELLFGKLVPYFCIGMLDLLIAVLMGKWLFQVPLRGDVLLLFATATVFLIGANMQGMVISIVAKNQLAASQMALLSTFMPAFLLSGFAFAIANMPLVLQPITYFIPARYFVEILKGIYLKGVGAEVLVVDISLLCVYAGAITLVANVRFKKKLS